MRRMSHYAASMCTLCEQYTTKPYNYVCGLSSMNPHILQTRKQPPAQADKTWQPGFYSILLWSSVFTLYCVLGSSKNIHEHMHSLMLF